MPGEENIIEEGERTLKKIPLPVVVIGVIVLAGVAYLILFKGSGGSSGAPSNGILPSISGDSGGSGSGIDTPPVASSSTPTNNNAWLSGAIDAVSLATGIDPYLVNVYLTQYLSGSSPSSNANAYSQFEKVVNSALQLFGQPPIALSATPTSGSFFKTATDWLSAGLSDLGAGNYNQAYADEIANFLNGSTKTLSTGAAALYQQISGNLGNAPGVGTYTITPAGGTTGGTTSPTVFTSTQVSSWQALFNSLIKSTPGGAANVTASSAFQAWTQSLNTIVPGVTTTLSQSQLASAFNLINNSLASPNSPFLDPNYVVSWLNSIVANPSQLGTSAPTTLYYDNGGKIVTSTFNAASTPLPSTNPIK